MESQAGLIVLSRTGLPEKIEIKPVLNAVTNISVCSGSAIGTINFSANTGGGEVFTWTNTNSAINLGAEGTGNILAFTATLNTSGVPIMGTISVQGKKNNLTSQSISFTITVEPEPVVAALDNRSFSSGATVNVPLTSNMPGSVQNWTNSNTKIGLPASGTGDIIYTAPVNNTNSDVTGIIIVTGTSNGCSSTGKNQKAFAITIKSLAHCLLAWYPFTGNASDSSGNNYNGAVYGATLTTDRFGNANSAYSFDGASNCISSANINLSGSSTISVWVYPIGSIGALVDKNKDAIDHAGYALIYNNPLHGIYAHVGWSGDSSNNVLPNPIDSLAVGNWHHCLLTYSNGTASLFLDGSLIYTRTGLNPITQNNDLLLFGKSVWGGNVFQGKLDEIRLWNRVITNDEIQYLYAH